MGKIIRNSLLCILAGMGISVLACFSDTVTEPVNYAGAMFILGGMIFIDQAMVQKVFQKDTGRKLSLVRLPVYVLLSVVLILVPIHMAAPEILMRLCRSFGIGFLLLALWRFFTFTTVEEEKLH